MPDITETESWLATEWSMIAGAPFLFIASVLVLGALIWLAIHFIYRERLKTLNERINLHKDRLDAGGGELEDVRETLSQIRSESEETSAKISHASLVADTVRKDLLAMRNELDGGPIGTGTVVGPVWTEDDERP